MIYIKIIQFCIKRKLKKMIKNKFDLLAKSKNKQYLSILGIS